MKTKTLIIGGGLTGLALGHRLQNAGHDYQLLEARNRFGGRIKSLNIRNQHFDLGPSWVWPGQHRIASLLQDLELGVFQQWVDGTHLYEQPNGEVMQHAGLAPMAGSLRIAGGTSALIGALVGNLDPARLHKGAIVTNISQTSGAALSDGRIFEADRIILAVPPRIAAQLTFDPVLPQNVTALLNAVPTWMGAHAKFIAVYPTPFWRDAGLSGDVSSRRGPLAEIHDASPSDGKLGALFGFIGLPADMRQRAGAALTKAALAQLESLFGSKAATPIVAHIEDWSQTRFTATADDAKPPPGHPAYEMPAALTDIWNGNLIFAVTELVADSGGLIEGALAAAEVAANQILSP